MNQHRVLLAWWRKGSVVGGIHDGVEGRCRLCTMTDSDFRLLIQRFYQLQAERVETYRLFDEGHQAYLKSGPHYDFIHYRQLVHEITQAFNGISKELIQMKDQFRELHDRLDLSEHLEKIQELEKEKLELTARLQLAKQNAQDHPSDESHQEEVQLLKHKIIKTVEAISEVLQDFKYDCEEIK